MELLRDKMAIDEKFAELVRSDVGCVVILAGSGSDDKVKEGQKFSHIEKIVASLERYGMPYEVRVASGHKQAEKFQAAVNEYDALGGALVYITVAGGQDAISGTSSSRSYHPTVSCPPDHPNVSSISTIPLTSNAYIANPDNAGRFVAQMFADRNPAYREKLENEIKAKRKSLDEDDKRLQGKYAERQRR